MQPYHISCCMSGPSPWIKHNPTVAGMDGSTFRMGDLLRPIMGGDFAEKSHEERTDEEKERFSRWCQLLKWYILLKRGGITPTFE